MNKKFSLLLLLLTAFVINTNAQTTAAVAPAAPAPAKPNWSREGSFVGLDFSETGFKDWANVSDDAIAGKLLVNLVAKYEKGKHNWLNNFNFTYGQTRLSSIGKFRKTDDKLSFLSNYGYKASKNWDYSAQVTLNTQATNGYVYNTDGTTKTLNHAIFAPLYAMGGIGMKYAPKEKPYWLYLSPVTNKFTYVSVTDLIDVYLKARPGEKAKNLTQGGGAHYRYELGAALTAFYQKDIFKNVNFKNQLDLFTDYLDNSHAVDVKYDALLSLTVNSYIKATAGLTVIYDADIAVPILTTNSSTGKRTWDGTTTGPRTQFRHNIGVGFLYKINK